MRRRSGTFARVATPLKSWFQRFALSLMILAAGGLLIAERINPDATRLIRVTIVDSFSPVLTAMTAPVSAGRELVNNVRSYGSLRAEVVQMREDLRFMERWEHVARNLEAENKKLWGQLRVTQDFRTDFVSARVVRDRGSSFIHSILVSAGKADGVKRGQAVLSSYSLAGRIIDVGRRSSRVLLVTDINSRIPCTLERSGVPAIAVGDNDNGLRLIRLTPEEVRDVRAGDRVVTSGAGGVFPVGFEIGIVQETVGDQVVVVSSIDWDRIGFATIVNYEHPDLLPGNAFETLE
jgi:rod shape-determining protein MreC